MVDEEEIDFSPLFVIDRVHEARYGTIKLLHRLFADIERVLPGLPRHTHFGARLYLQRLVLELTCQYVEDVGSYSVACLETGFLYVQRAMSVTSKEIGRFYDRAETLSDSELYNMFFAAEGVDPSRHIDYPEVRARYKDIKDFRAKYLGLYNALKHGNRVLHFEMSTKDSPMDSLYGTYVTYQWAEPKRGSRTMRPIRTRAGSEVKKEIADFVMRTELMLADSLDEFVQITEYCHRFLTDILSAHSPPPAEN